MTRRNTLAIDFDGVLHQRNSAEWKGIAIIEGNPVPDAVAALHLLSHRYELVIHTCRAVHPDGERAVTEWMAKHGFPPCVVTAQKPAAIAYIDDRGLQFISWDNVLRIFT